MALSADIYNALIADSALTALVPVSNIFMQRRTNEVAFPSLNLSQDGGIAMPVFAGEVAQQMPVYVYEILGTSYDYCYAIDEALKDALINTTHATFTALREVLPSHLFDEDTKVHELIGALSIFYNGD